MPGQCLYYIVFEVEHNTVGYIRMDDYHGEFCFYLSAIYEMNLNKYLISLKYFTFCFQFKVVLSDVIATNHFSQ